MEGGGHGGGECTEKSGTEEGEMHGTGESAEELETKGGLRWWQVSRKKEEGRWEDWRTRVVIEGNFKKKAFAYMAAQPLHKVTIMWMSLTT